jgi:hypothetical protein
VNPSYAGEQFVAQIGEIHVTNVNVYTPMGSFPLRGSAWQAQDQWEAKQTIPQWAIICAVVGFFLVCVFSLFFLLAKETTYNGTVQISVVGPQGQAFSTRIPVSGASSVPALHQQVTYLRYLATQ